MDLEYCLVMYVYMCVVGVEEERRRELTLRGIPAPCAHSALWVHSVRDNVTNNKVSEQVMSLSLTQSHAHAHLHRKEDLRVGVVLLKTSCQKFHSEIGRAHV